MGKVPGHGVCTDDGRARPAGPATQDPRSHPWEDFRNDSEMFSLHFTVVKRTFGRF